MNMNMNFSSSSLGQSDEIELGPPPAPPSRFGQIETDHDSMSHMSQNSSSNVMTHGSSPFPMDSMTHNSNNSDFESRGLHLEPIDEKNSYDASFYNNVNPFEFNSMAAMSDDFSMSRMPAMSQMNGMMPKMAVPNLPMPSHLSSNNNNSNCNNNSINNNMNDNINSNDNNNNDNNDSNEMNKSGIIGMNGNNDDNMNNMNRMNGMNDEVTMNTLLPLPSLNRNSLSMSMSGDIDNNEWLDSQTHAMNRHSINSVMERNDESNSVNNNNFNPHGLYFVQFF